MQPEYEDEIIESLENSFGELDDPPTFADTLLSAAKNAVEDNMPDYLRDLMHIRKDSFLEELDDFNVEAEYQAALQNNLAERIADAFSEIDSDISTELLRSDCKEVCLYIALHIAFACNTREGEVCGLQWDRVHISDEDIQEDNARIVIDRTLSRVSKKAMKKLGKKDILFVFPVMLKSEEEAVQRLVLKRPKTKSSNRTVWIPVALAHILRDYKNHQDNIKAVMGKEYTDYGLVLAQGNGRPYDGNLISRKFRQLIAAHDDLPKVVFHSLRVSATTYKLALSKGDIKSVQGDNGHATADMTLRTYARVLDSGRKVNAQRFNEFFYPGNYVRSGTDAAPPAMVSSEDLIEQVKKSPELLATLAVMLKDVMSASSMHEHAETTHMPSGATKPHLTLLK